MKLIENNEDAINNLVDILNMATITDNQRDRYINLLKTKYDYEYIPMDDDSKIQNIDFNNLYSKEDFSTYDAYREYAEQVFKKRKYKININNQAWEPITIEEVATIVEESGLPIDIKHNKTQYLAYSSTNDIVMNEKADKGTIIHELGHVVQNNEKYYSGILLDIVYACSLYGITNAGECFAEGFYHFITDNNYKHEFPESYQEFKKFKKYIDLAYAILEF